MANAINQMGFSPNFKAQDEEFEDDYQYFGCDFDRPGAEGMCDLAEIYYDYYFNDERRWDNEENWDENDDYFNPSLLGPTEHYDDQDQEEWEIQQEYEAQYDIGDVWTYLADVLIDKIQGEEWRDRNT
tara:strand:- start:366 stop:749 length:384 start_codon:yes stop_codon:yes gene_type:complete